MPADVFHYYFELKLEDADTTKPITARLQYGTKDGSGWQDCPDEYDSIVSLTYSGSDPAWSGEMAYDIFHLDLDWDAGEYGLLRQVRIVCDYTLKDGTKGTVYSSECGELYAYKGSYVTTDPDSDGCIGTFDSDGMHVTYRLLTNLLFDPSKVELTGFYVRLDSMIRDIDPSKVTMTGPNADGTFTLFCPADAIVTAGEVPQLDSDDHVGITLYYNDKKTAELMDVWR